MSTGRAGPGWALEPVWFIHVELGPDDHGLYDLIAADLPLAYGLSYSGVALEGAEGLQRYRSKEGSIMGRSYVPHRRAVRVLSFSIPRNDAVLSQVMTLVHHYHSYEEPVIYAFDGLASRAQPRDAAPSPFKWWTRV